MSHTLTITLTGEEYQLLRLALVNVIAFAERSTVLKEDVPAFVALLERLSREFNAV
jgi:hypothetical protein